MSKKNRERQSTPQATAPPGLITYTTTLKPRPKLLLALSIIFGLWVALLLVMYFTTVRR
jgi:uncharacterized protein involved in exopolysaccharide biosynthesis